MFKERISNIERWGVDLMSGRGGGGARLIGAMQIRNFAEENENVQGQADCQISQCESFHYRM